MEPNIETNHENNANQDVPAPISTPQYEFFARLVLGPKDEEKDTFEELVLNFRKAKHALILYLEKNNLSIRMDYSEVRVCNFDISDELRFG